MTKSSQIGALKDALESRDREECIAMFGKLKKYVVVVEMRVGLGTLQQIAEKRMSQQNTEK